MNRQLAMLLACWVLSGGCAATETGNPVAAQRMALTARSSADAVALGMPSAGELSIREAWVVLGDIRFVQSTACDRSAEQQVDISGPIVVDLVGQPEVLEFEVEQARYCRVRVPLERADDEVADGAPGALADHAILIRGTTAAGTAFVIRSRRTREADIRSRAEPFSLAEGDASLILAFDVGRWFDGVQLDGAEVQDDGVIWIDDEYERDRLERFEENVESAMELFRDHDDDEQLDEAEAAVPLATGG